MPGTCRHPILGTLLLAATSCCCGPALAQDWVFRDGAVYTVDEARPWARHVAVRDGLIAYVGDDADAARAAAPGATEIDLAGRMLMPGFHDAHMHPMAAGTRFLRCQLGGLVTPAAVMDALRACAMGLEPGDWLRAVGLDAALVGRTEADLRRLDRATAGHPAVLNGWDGSSVWANSEAMALAGIEHDVSQPERGAFERDPDSGALTGVLSGDASNGVWVLQNRYEPVELREALRRAAAMANGFGITSSDESAASTEHWRAYRAAEAAGELTLRITASMRWDDERDVSQLVEFEAMRLAADGPLFQARAIKLFLDGSALRTARLLAPYAGTTDDFGRSNYGARLPAIVAAIDGAGFDLHAHAFGDAAVRDGLDAIEAAMMANPPRDRRHQLAHVALIAPSDLPRFRALDVTADIQPLWAWLDDERREEVEAFGQERVERFLAFRDLFDTGARVAAGSDWISASMNPLYGIQVALTRRPPDGSGPAWNPGQRVALDEMLHAYTLNGAWLARQEHLTGSIEVGKAADLVVLERNLFEVDPMVLKDVAVDLTLLGGEAVFRRVHAGP